MSNLDNLTSKILADAKAQADKIVKDAQEKAQHKYDLEIKKINAKKETVLENPLPKVEYTDEISKFVSGTYADRQSGKLTAREFCKEYLKYYNK